MTGPTHKQFSVCGAFIASMVLYKLGLTQINYYLALPLLILLSRYGALFPDIDHNWQNVKEKTVPNWIINKLIHITGGKHRSWQTHSIDIVVLVSTISYFLPNFMFSSDKISLVNKEVLSIILFGFCSGWISHIISDMLTSAGVRLTCFSKFKVALVPKHIGKLKFNTGNEWEGFMFKVIRVINIILGIACLIYPFLVPGNYQDLANRLTATFL